MGLKTITPPSVEPISLEEAKQHLRVDDNENDIAIASLIKQAREYCEKYQRKKYITQTLELVLDSFPGYIEFKECSPVQSITSIKYTDCDGVETTLDSSCYILDNDSFVNKIVLAYNKEWPYVTLQPVNGVRVRFVAGYGSDSTYVPETVKWAMVLHIKLLYDDYSPDERKKMEETRDALLSMDRVMSV